MIYLLPRQDFSQLKREDGRLKQEWASTQSTRAVAGLAVSPTDFPYVNDVKGHDDTDELRLRELSKWLLSATQKVEELPDGFQFSYAWDKALFENLADFIGNFAAAIPWATYQVVISPKTQIIHWSLTGTGALKEVIAGWIRKGEL